MPDTKESFEILEDASGGGVACTKSEAGDSATGKVGPTVFSHRDSSGNLILPQLDSLGRMPVSLRSDGSPGSAAPSIANLVGGSDGSSLRSILVDSSGRPIITRQDTQGSGSIAALNGVISVATEGMSALGFGITGTWSATLIAEGSRDGSTWEQIEMIIAPHSVILLSTNANVSGYIPCAGYSSVRIRASAYTSGSATVTLNAASGYQALARRQEAYSYHAASQGFTVAASPTDIWRILGSATKIIRIKRIGISGSTTSGSPILVTASLLKRSTANTGGTAVSATAVPNDSTNPAATASLNHYTANPTLGTLVGNIRGNRWSFNNNGNQPNMIEWIFGEDTQPLVLRGAAEQISINLNSTSITGSNISVYAEWMEI